MNNLTPHFNEPDKESNIHVPATSCPHGTCPCAHARSCSIWMELIISCVSLAEQDELLHGNWTEITHLRNRIDYLEGILESHGIDYLPEYMTD